MSKESSDGQATQHAFLVVWGWFAQEIGLVERLQKVTLKQKRYHHTPQGKVIEFLVGILAGLPHLQEISLAAHPLDKDQVVAAAWGQQGWADYSGVSRTLRSLSWAEVKQIVAVLEGISQPYLTAELALLQQQGERLRYDGDLTGLAVSNRSQSYPQAAYGYMGAEVRLGYQAGVVSLTSPTYRRLWLSIAHHPGDTVSCTQAEALVLAAEARTGQRPQRRTALLRQRLADFSQQMSVTQQRLVSQQQAVQRSQERLHSSEQQKVAGQRQLAELTQLYQSRQRRERPTSRLAQTRHRLATVTKRCQRRQQAWQQAQRRLTKTTAQCATQQQEFTHLSERLQRFEQENATNLTPMAAEFRLDAGFGTYTNLALLIEMGYEVYTKPHSHALANALQRQTDDQTPWLRVGANAELTVWADHRLAGSPYPLDVALERFYTGDTCKHSALLHFGADPVTENLVAWFDHYNQRQTIEAGIKECKQVFSLHRLKVRSEPAIYLQEAFIIFAANFIRWATHWLNTHAHADENALQVRTLGVKRQVQVAAHVSAQVFHNSDARLLTFSDLSAFAGLSLRLPNGTPSPALLPKS